jgi:hypothetical protein
MKAIGERLKGHLCGRWGELWALDLVLRMHKSDDFRLIGVISERLRFWFRSLEELWASISDIAFYSSVLFLNH